MFQLRDYQQEITAQSLECLKTGNTVLVSETGSGKTVMFSYLTMRFVGQFKRVYLIAHRINICEQICATLEQFGIQFGRLMPGYPERHNHLVTVCMVQRVANRLDDLPEPDVLIVDEAHHSLSPTYLKIFERWLYAPVLGATATPIYEGGRGLRRVFAHMVKGPTCRNLINRGALSDYLYYMPPSFVQADKLVTHGGDYTASSAARAANNVLVTGDAEKHYRKYLDGRPAIAFCATVQHAKDVAQFFQDRGWIARWVAGATDQAERAAHSETLRALGRGEVNVVASCDLISEGTDIPTVSGCIMLRKSKSLIVVKQQWGRALRPKPDKAIILDHVGNGVMGFPDTDYGWNLDGLVKTKPPAVATCPECYASFPPTKVCPSCGHAFPGGAGGGKRMAASQVDGELVLAAGGEASEDKVLFNDDPDLKKAVRAAGALSDLQKIAKERGFKPQWAWLQWKMKQHKRPEAPGLPEMRG